MSLSANRLQCRPNLSVTVQRPPPQIYDGATLVEWKPETAVEECTKAALLYEGLRPENVVECWEATRLAPECRPQGPA